MPEFALQNAAKGISVSNTLNIVENGTQPYLSQLMTGIAHRLFCSLSPDYDALIKLTQSPEKT